MSWICFQLDVSLSETLRFFNERMTNVLTKAIQNDIIILEERSETWL